MNDDEEMAESEPEVEEETGIHKKTGAIHQSKNFNFYLIRYNCPPTRTPSGYYIG